MSSSMVPVVESPFPHPFSVAFSTQAPACQTFRTVEERAMIKLSWDIRKKPEWWKKYKNPEIVAKWYSECESFISSCVAVADEGYKAEEEEEGENNNNHENRNDNGNGNIEDSDALLKLRTRKFFDYVIAELAFYERVKDFTDGKFQLGPYDYIFFGDNVIPDNLKEEFVTAAKNLEDVPESMKDWHPGSNKRVLDLVHPSLYPLQYGITPVVADLENDHVGLDLEYNGELMTMPKFDPKKDIIKQPPGPRESIPKYAIGERFQWLPSVFSINENGSEVTVKSYINNLHPIQYLDLYQPIANIFAKFIPGLNECAGRVCSDEFLRHPAMIVDCKHERDDDGEPINNDCGGSFEHSLEGPIPQFEIPDLNGREKFSFNGRDVKVIVKMANIELTPERPDYPGGTWHLEGTINEDIIATCLYYYDCENITYSELKFRAAVQDPGYPQYDQAGVLHVYGINDSDIISMPVGSVESVENRLIVFPNMFQHQVSPFELKDKTKPGHRKILCFFVCDPFNSHVITTDQVPAQQLSWWADQVTREGQHSRLANLPPELFSNIIENMDWPMSLKKAKEIRDELMDERKIAAINGGADDGFSENAYERNFSLCEH